jgi:hypothetical protein
VSISVQPGQTLTFDRFWRWILEHPNCVLRAGTADAILYDLDDLHWHFYEDPEHTPVIQLIRGKQLVAEILLDRRDILFVQVTPDSESEERGRFLFELIGGPKDDTYPICHFLIAHGLEEDLSGHLGGLKH